MCFTLISYADKEMNKDITTLAYTQHSRWNDDGYALRDFDRSVLTRTMDKNTFEKEMSKVSSGIVQVHFRKSTNNVCSEFIHLWRRHNFTFGHNGILMGIHHKNDSLGFLNLYQSAIANRNIPEVKKILEGVQGTGVFTILYDDGYSMLISYGKSLKVAASGDNIVFSSDTINFKESMLYGITVMHKGFKFRSQYTVESKTAKLEWVTAEIENAIIVVDKAGNLQDRIPLERQFPQATQWYKEHGYATSAAGALWD